MIPAIIIGAGPAGLAAALRLHQQTNIQVTIYELRTEPTTLGGAVGIPPNGLRLLHRLGVYEEVAARGFTSSNLTVHSLQGHIISQQDFVGWARERTGFGYMRIKRTDLVAVLLEAVQHAKIPIRFHKRLMTIEESDTSVQVTFEDGSRDTADMLFGCDGIHSIVRRTYVDPNKTLEYSGMSGLGSVIPTKVLSPLTTAQITGLDTTLTEDGMLAVNPCTAGKEEMFCFFSKEVTLPQSGDTRDGWELHMKEEVDGFKSSMLQSLQSAQGEWGIALREVLNNMSSVNFYPVYRLSPGGVWSKGRCLLVGDAAHAMSPHAGQGVSMALEDIFLLSRLLEDPLRPLNKVFDIYDRIRRPRINEIFKLAAQNAGVRKKTGPWGLWLKEVQISIAATISWVLGADKRGLRQGYLVYDIDEECII
ncbi:6-hydroxynicotinate 3-monooxygenase [Penicillium rolfsii]|nr:6-hydroxynicotinate 3-monooxygenase [Penicillium rolfsii]